MALPIDAPKRRHKTLTPDNDADLAPQPDCLYVAAAGDVQLVDGDGTSITYADVPVGIFPFRPKRLGEATTATVIGWNE